MDLRRRTLLVVALLMAGIAIALYLVLQTTVLNGLSFYEREDAANATKAFRTDFADALVQMQGEAEQYAAMRGVGDYLESRNLARLKASVPESQFAGKGIVIVVLVGANGRPACGFIEQEGDWETKGFTAQINKELKGGAWPAWSSYSASDASRLRGVIKIGKNNYIVAAAPVRPAGGHSSRGYLMIGRRFGLDNFPVKPRAPGDSQLALFWEQAGKLPTDVSKMAKRLDEKQQVQPQILNGTMVSGYTYFTSVPGTDRLLVRLSVPRRVAQTGMAFASRALWVLAASVILGGGFLWFMLDRQILLRLTKLSHGVSQVGQQADPSLRVNLSGDDEVKKLSDSINSMLSELERAQADVKESESRFSSLSAASFEAILIHDGTVAVEGNQALLDLFGYERRQLIGERIEKLSPSYLGDSIWQLAKAAGVDSFEASGVTLAGNAIPLEVRCRTMPYRGREMMVAAIRDISERKAAEQALRESEESYRRLIDLAQEGIVSCDANEIVRFCNPTFASVLGYSPSELIGRSIIDICRPSSGERILQESAKRHSGLTGTYEVELLTRDARVRSFHLTACPMFDANGTFEGTLGVFTDITERKQTEQAWLAAQKAESLGVLAGGIAHDFNNLLVGIIGNVSLALDTLPPASPVLKFLTEIDKASQRAKELVELMLAYSGRGRLALRKIDVNKAIEETLGLMGTSLPPDVHIELELQQDLPSVDADEVLMRQMVTSVLLNSFEALRDAKGTVSIKTYQTVLPAASIKKIDASADPKDDRYCVIEVIDSGVGMDRQTLEKIFDPFFSTKFAGRGLGLPAVQGIVKRHRGELQVESEQGKGSVFRILLPVSKAVKAPPDATRSMSSRSPELAIPAPPKQNGSAPSPQASIATASMPVSMSSAQQASISAERLAPMEATNGKHTTESAVETVERNGSAVVAPGRRVLVIAQETTVGQVTRRILEQQNFSVLTANNGATGIRRFSQSPEDFDLVLLDLDLQDMPGLEVLSAIRRTKPDVGILLLTGELALNLERELAAFKILRKPFAPALLLQEIETLV